MGSICGGGRYDDLTALFGLNGMSGVGISFGADRIFDVLEELKLFPESVSAAVKVMFINFGDIEQGHCLRIAKELRENEISCEVYPSSVKMQKQMKYANAKNIPFVVLIGTKEIDEDLITFKNMESGEQTSVQLNEFIKLIKA